MELLEELVITALFKYLMYIEVSTVSLEVRLFQSIERFAERRVAEVEIWEGH